MFFYGKIKNYKGRKSKDIDAINRRIDEEETRKIEAYKQARTIKLQRVLEEGRIEETEVVGMYRILQTRDDLVCYLNDTIPVEYELTGPHISITSEGIEYLAKLNVGASDSSSKLKIEKQRLIQEREDYEKACTEYGFKKYYEYKQENKFKEIKQGDENFIIDTAVYGLSSENIQAEKA